MKRIILAAALVASTAAHASWYSGKDLHQLWVSGEHHNRSLVFGYIMAVASLENKRLFCIPSRQTSADITNTVTRQLFLFSELQNTFGHAAVVNALQTTYPCKVINVNY
jgi:hypothetical protein